MCHTGCGNKGKNQYFISKYDPVVSKGRTRVLKQATIASMKLFTIVMSKKIEAPETRENYTYYYGPIICHTVQVDTCEPCCMTFETIFVKN